MGARPSSFKKGGGFLNNVDAKIASYEITDTFPGSEGEKSSNSDFNPLFFVLTVRPDGADKDESTTLLMGSSDDFEIEDEGKTIVPVDGAGLRANTPFAFFLDSMIEAGFPESNLPDDDEPINFEAILNWRVRLVQVADTDAMAKMAKKAKTSKGKYNDQGQKKGKDGKYYNLTRLKVDQVYGEDEAKPAAKGAKVGTKVAVVTKAGKGATTNIEDEAVSTLLAILTDNDGSVPKASLPNKTTQKLGMKHPKRDEIRKLVYSDEFLETEQGWTYDKASKKQLITIAEEEG